MNVVLLLHLLLQPLPLVALALQLVAQLLKLVGVPSAQALEFIGVLSARGSHGFVALARCDSDARAVGEVRVPFAQRVGFCARTLLGFDEVLVVFEQNVTSTFSALAPLFGRLGVGLSAGDLGARLSYSNVGATLSACGGTLSAGDHGASLSCSSVDACSSITSGGLSAGGACSRSVPSGTLA